MYNYRPGELRERVVIKKPVYTPDGQGGSTKSYVATLTTWAKYVESNGSEKFQHDRVNAEKRGMFVMRRTDIDERFKIDWNGREFNVRHVNDQGARFPYIEVEVESGVAI